MGHNEQTIISYMLADGRKVDVEVSNAVKDFLESDERQRQSLLRKERRYKVSPCSNDLLDATIAAANGDMAERLIRIEEQQRLAAAISILPPKQQRRLLLYFSEQLTCREIAEIENVSDSAVCSSVQKAIRRLQKVYQP